MRFSQRFALVIRLGLGRRDAISHDCESGHGMAEIIGGLRARSPGSPDRNLDQCNGYLAKFAGLFTKALRVDLRSLRAGPEALNPLQLLGNNRPGCRFLWPKMNEARRRLQGRAEPLGVRPTLSVARARHRSRPPYGQMIERDGGPWPRVCLLASSPNREPACHTNRKLWSSFERSKARGRPRE
jgi:hypothetical protein